MRHSMAPGAMAALVSLLAVGLASAAESPEDAAQAAATETIRPMVDGDRAWRVSGYFIR